MKLQIELLRQKLGGNRVILSPEYRVRMLRARAEMDHVAQDMVACDHFVKAVWTPDWEPVPK